MKLFVSAAFTLVFLLVFVSPAQADIKITLAEIQNGFVHVEGEQAPRAQAISWDGVSVGVNTNDGGTFQFDTTNLPLNCVGTVQIGSETRGVVINNCTPAAITVIQAGVPQTGQTTSFDANSPQRDDGALMKGVALPKPRFTDNSNGTITDNLTGLIWLKNANCSGIPAGSGVGRNNWQTALNDVARLNTDGTMNGNNCGDTSNGGSHQSDWRLPNIRELFSLVDFAFTNPSISNAAGTDGGLFGPESGDPFLNLQPGAYWSSTTLADGPPFVGNIGSAWAVCFSICASFYFDYGSVGQLGKTASINMFFTAVRGGS